MVVLISVFNSEGEYRRCDEKCYNATLPKCGCVCGGANHGKGLKEALEWTQKNGQALAQRIGATVSAPLL